MRRTVCTGAPVSHHPWCSRMFGFLFLFFSFLSTKERVVVLHAGSGVSQYTSLSNWSIVSMSIWEKGTFPTCASKVASQVSMSISAIYIFVIGVSYPRFKVLPNIDVAFLSIFYYHDRGYSLLNLVFYNLFIDFYLNYYFLFAHSSKL